MSNNIFRSIHTFDGRYCVKVVTDSEESDHVELVEEEIQENEEELEDESHLALVIRKLLKTQVTENYVDDQRDNLFHTKCLVKGNPYSTYYSDQKIANFNPTPF